MSFRLVFKSQFVLKNQNKVEAGCFKGSQVPKMKK